MNKRVVLIAAALKALLGTLALSGCNAPDGFGKDIEKMGESIQDDDE